MRIVCLILALLCGATPPVAADTTATSACAPVGVEAMSCCCAACACDVAPGRDDAPKAVAPQVLRGFEWTVARVEYFCVVASIDPTPMRHAVDSHAPGRVLLPVHAVLCRWST